LVLLLLFALLFLSPRAQAQLVSDGGTATINGTTNNLGGDLTVGTNGGNTTLILTNGAVVNSGNALIGLNAGATNNLVAVSGTGSRLTTAGGLSVFRIGNGGAFNRLLISQGGAVSNGYGVIGYLAGASNNSVLVTDAGSAWTNNVLYLGENGSGNSLTIANAGRVVANDSTIGLVAGASNNSAVVTGTNSLWSTAGTLLVGDAGGGSRLWVNRGGAVASTGLVLGNQSTSGGNLLSLAGANSALTVTNGGGTGTLDVRRGVVELNGGTLTADRLLLTNGAGSFSFNDGTLITRSATISNGQAFVVGRSSNALPLSPVLLNATSMTLPGSGTAGPASIYPSVINVTNVGGPITKLTVTLGGFSHSYPRDLDIMLVGPAGQKVMLMSDVGGVNPGISSVNLTFDDAAGVAVPDTNPPTGASYRPTDAAPGDPFPYPMPAGPYSTNLSDFNGTSANGAWSLYVVDDASGDSGSLSSWGLQITTAGPAATWDVRSNAVPTTLANDLLLGSTASSATLLVTNGATLHVNGFSSLGTEAGSTNNRAIIAGPRPTAACWWSALAARSTRCTSPMADAWRATASSATSPTQTTIR
jgi:T5SS/PEP-CTERM-associated repeat protein